MSFSFILLGAKTSGALACPEVCFSQVHAVFDDFFAVEKDPAVKVDAMSKWNLQVPFAKL